MLFGLRPYEVMVKSFRPYLKPIATLNVRGWMSSVDGESLGLKWIYQTNILSKDVELKCSYFTALIFLYFDRISMIFFVGKMATSRIYLTNSIQPRMDWMGERRVSTRVS